MNNFFQIIPTKYIPLHCIDIFSLGVFRSLRNDFFVSADVSVFMCLLMHNQQRIFHFILFHSKHLKMANLFQFLGEINLKHLNILGSAYGNGEVHLKKGSTITWSRPKQNVKNILNELKQTVSRLFMDISTSIYFISQAL